MTRFLPPVIGGLGSSDGRSAYSHCGVPKVLLVLTRDGALPVEYLYQGDRIITRDQGYATLLGLDHILHLTAQVTVSAGAFGPTTPERDVTIPADQLVLVRDWRAEASLDTSEALLPARELVDGRSVRHAGIGAMSLFGLRFDRAQVIYAGGLQLGTAGQARDRRAA